MTMRASRANARHSQVDPAGRWWLKKARLESPFFGDSLLNCRPRAPDPSIEAHGELSKLSPKKLSRRRCRRRGPAAELGDQLLVGVEIGEHDDLADLGIFIA